MARINNTRDQDRLIREMQAQLAQNRKDIQAIWKIIERLQLRQTPQQA